MNQTVLEPTFEHDRYEQIKHDFTFGIAPTRHHDKIVLAHAGTGYAHYRVRIVDWPESLKDKYTIKDVALVAAEGNMPFGYRVDGSCICIHTD